MPEVSAQNQSFSGLKHRRRILDRPGEPLISPEANEWVVVTKRRVSALTAATWRLCSAR